ncbi:MAG: phage holin family protein [Desulfomonile tiedjei]|nr:phage holin family protein [Desulfomonile tiedjei]
MLGILLSWAIVTLAILAAAYIVPGVRVANVKSAVIAAAILGVLNVLVKPIITFLLFPFIWITLGLLLFVINAFMFWLVAQVMDDFQVDSFGSALLGSLVVSVVSFVVHLVLY